MQKYIKPLLDDTFLVVVCKLHFIFNLRVDGEHRKVHLAEESNDSSTVDPETEGKLAVKRSII